MEVPSNSALSAICLNISQEIAGALHSEVVGMLQGIYLPGLLYQVRVLSEHFQAALLERPIPRSDLLLFGAGGLSQGCPGCGSPRGMLSTGSGEGCFLLGLGDCLGTGKGAAGADCSSTGVVLCDKVNG